MRRAGWWLLCAALWAAAASAQPVLVDPTPDDDDTDWGLAIEATDLGGATLAMPTGLVLLGSRTLEELLVLEKHTGRVRHFAEGVELPVALDLGVDTCGERGLIDIALHPFFDRGAPDVAVPDPEDPDKVKEDWIYLSYHTDAGAGPGDDGCDDADGALFRVARYTWNGSQLVDGVVVFEKALAPGETAELGGPIAFGFDVDPDQEFVLVASLFIAIGALGGDGALQNDKASATPWPPGDAALDDTSVLLRLTDEGATPTNNPFDLDDDATGKEERYYAYGFRDPRGLVVDPPSQIFGTRLWMSERSDDGKDEIDLLESLDNGGYSPYQGRQLSVPDNLLENGDLNPAYPLVDLADGLDRDEEVVPISTYSNPPFTFEQPEIRPTGLAFGGVEAGLLHRQALFAGTEEGRLLRFAIDNQRLGILAGGTLADLVANEAVEDDPETEPDEERDADDLTQITIATGFGALSDLETGVDGSVYVVDQENGVIYRVFSDAVRDLAVASLKAPKKIALSDKRPTVTRAIQVTLVNQGDVPERIIAERGDDSATPDVDEAVESRRENLAALIELELTSDTGCATPVTRVVVPKYALPPNTPAIGIAANGGRLTLDVEVDWTCAAPSPKGVADFAASASVDMQTLGIIESADLQTDNVCPRPPDPDPAAEDRGCGAKTETGLGGPIVTDVTRK
jgi:hypothetical protein